MGVDRADSDDVAEIEALLRWSFNVPPEAAKRWVERGPIENWWVGRERGRVTACLLSIPCGHFFGGTSVPARAICAVAVAPEARGEGRARALLTEVLRSCTDEGVGLASLYSSTQALYRGLGFDSAGVRYRHWAPIGALGAGSKQSARSRNCVVRPLAAEDDAVVRELQHARAREWNGTVDRGEYFWSRIREVRGVEVRGFGLERDTELCGYVYVHIVKEADSITYGLRLVDYAVADGAAVCSLLAFLHRHGSLADNVSWAGGPADPLALAIAGGRCAAELALGYWMLRVVSVPRALEARGYPPSVAVELELDMVDPMLPENYGRWVLTIAGGRGALARGGAGRFRIRIDAFAPLYTGLVPATTLRQMGMVEADDASVTAANVAFGGPTPWTSEAW